MGLLKREKKNVFYFLIKINGKSMFSNFIERLGHKKTKTKTKQKKAKQQQANKEKPRKK